MPVAEQQLLQAAAAIPKALSQRIETAEVLSDADKDALLSMAKTALAGFVAADVAVNSNVEESNNVKNNPAPQPEQASELEQ